MDTMDREHLRQWIGRQHVDHDISSLRHARLMAATVDRGGPALQDGDALPPLWHWLYFLDGLPPAQLGPDGHPARGGFLPPVPLSNRMWAGGRIDFLAPLPIGTAIEKRSRVQSIEHKHGRSGDLVFVTVLHEVLAAGTCCLREEHDIVYRNPVKPGPVPASAADQPAAEHQRTWQPDSTQLFRYSALTFNGHRIHYDADYCRQVEGYDNLVIHGPLIATMLAALASEVGDGALKRFTYRALHPALLGAPLMLNARRDGIGWALWTTLADGRVGMQAEASLGG